MDTSILKQKVRDHIQKYGSPQSWFSNQLGISQTHFSLWLKGDRELSEERENHLRKIFDNLEK